MLKEQDWQDINAYGTPMQYREVADGVELQRTEDGKVIHSAKVTKEQFEMWLARASRWLPPEQGQDG